MICIRFKLIHRGEVMKIEIISVLNEVEKYIQLVEQGKNADEAWEKIVIAPYWEKLCCYAPMDLSDRKPKAIKDIDALKEQVSLLKKVDMENMKNEFEKTVQVLPNYDEDPITVAVFPLDNENVTVKEKQNGVVGTSLFGNLIIQINPFAEAFEKWIPYAFAHEYHHTVWGNYWFMIHNGELESKFIDALIIDGEADSFALSLYPDLKPKWIFDLSEEIKLALWHKHYEGIVMKKDVDYPKYMFGDEASEIPWCAGYAVGYMLVQKYLKKTGSSITSLVQIKPEDILNAVC